MQAEFEDYYEILKVSPDAKAEEIRTAYLDKCFILHPDRLGGRESAKRLAEDELKKVNRAYEVLGNEKKRQVYHQEWLRQAQIHHGKPTASTNHGAKPKPVLEPTGLRLANVEPHQPQKASFIIRNLGGQCATIDISPHDPDSFVRVVNFASLSPNDELPARVDIEVEGGDWGQSYRDFVTVLLDGEEARFNVELQTSSCPSASRPASAPLGAQTQAVPPHPMAGERHILPVWARWLIGVGVTAIALAFVVPSVVTDRLLQPLVMDNIYLWIAVTVGLVFLWFIVGRRNSKYFWITLALLIAFMALSMTLALGWAILAVAVASSLIIYVTRKKQEKLARIRWHVHRGQYLSQPTQLLKQRLAIIDRDKLVLRERIKLCSMARPSARYGDYDIDRDDMQAKIRNLVSELEDLERQERDILRVLRQRGANKM